MRHMRQLHYPGARCDGGGICPDDLRIIVVAEIEVHRDDVDALALLALPPGQPRAWDAPRRHDYIVSGFEGYAEDGSAETFRGVPVERYFVRSAACEQRQLSLGLGQQRIQMVPHVHVRVPADELERFGDGVLDDERGRAG